MKDRRLVVLIDDLDRCNPELLPQLLLSLRELLDLPGFTFLLAFDDEIVARALTENNPAWVEGSNFLEKILDFRFHLPTITEPQKKRLIDRATAKYCPFVPAKSTEEIQDLLPNNPRKLKALIRSLAALGPQVTRHDPDELNWVDMWLAQMLRLESYPFFELLLQGDILDKEVGMLYRLLESGSRNKLKDEGAEKNRSLRTLIKKSGVKDSVVEERLVQLVEASRSRSSANFRYICELSVRPHAVTWKEFRQFYANWVADSTPEMIAHWIAQHAEDRGVSTDDVERELFDALMRKRHGCLAAAAESVSIEENASLAEEARLLLMLIKQYLLNFGKLNASRFRELFGQVSYWIGFRRNASDKNLRAREEEVLRELLTSASGPLVLELLEVVIPENSFPDLGEGVEQRQALRERCLLLVSAKAAKEAVDFLGHDGNVRRLTERGRFIGVKYCLFKPDSAVWKTGLRNDLLKLVRSGQEDNEIYRNLRDLFELLVQGLQYGIDAVSREDVAAVLANEEFVGCLWAAIVSRGIQYRMLITYIQARRSLIQNGIAESAMPLTIEMQARLDEDGSQPNVKASDGPEIFD